jgi:5-formyltetrahydrofolate cyclo-ligase
MNITERKAELRSKIRAARRELSPAEREEAALRMAGRLMEISGLVNAEYVLAYMPMKYELDILPTVEILKARGVKVVFPLCIENGGLRLFVPAEKNGFRPGAYGISEPDPETAEEITADRLGAILLPAIGFDREGRRLGQGGGYYDRLLARTDCLKIAVGFDCQLVDNVPTEETDERVDIVVVPGETIVI